MSTYPGTVDSFQAISGTTLVTSIPHNTQHNTAGSALVALETLLGTASASLTGVLGSFGTADKAAMRGKLHFGATAFNLGTTSPSSGQALVYNGTEILGSTITGGGTAGTLVFGTLVVPLSTATQSSFPRILFNSGTEINARGPGANNSYLRINSSALDWTSVFTPTPSVASDSAGGTITLTPNTQVFEVTLGTTAGNRTIRLTTATAADGQFATIRIKQNAAATGTILWDSAFRFSSDIGTPALGTASTWNYFTWSFGSTDTKWDFINQSKNII